VLSEANPYGRQADTPVEVIAPEIDEKMLSVKVIKVIKSAPANLAIEDADIVVAGEGVRGRVMPLILSMIWQGK
jgi:hypothetical protein